MHNVCMATKTISVKVEAYERLKRAKTYSSESFSEVVMRASWPEHTLTAKGLVILCRERGPIFDETELDRIDALKSAGEFPEDKWGDH